MRHWRVLCLLALAVVAARGAVGDDDPRRRLTSILMTEPHAARMRAQIRLPDLCFRLEHLKILGLGAGSEEFAAKEVEALELLESAGLSRLFERSSPRGCEVVAQFRPGRLLDIEGPVSGSESLIIDVRFAIETEWQPWTRTPQAEELFDFPEAPRVGSTAFKLEGQEFERHRGVMTATAPAPAACRIDCEGSGRCGGSTLDDFAGFEATMDHWSRECDSSAPFIAVSAGRCADGTRFLVNGKGFGHQTRYFDSQGRFKSLVRQSDAMDATCSGQRYWPQPSSCRLGVITEAYCGGFERGMPVGTRHWLPEDSASGR